jgi:hypothetical protein
MSIYRVEVARFLGGKQWIYIPDARTLVIADQDNLLRTLRRGGPPEYARDTELARLSLGLVAVVLDNGDDRVAQMMHNGEKNQWSLTPLVKNAQRGVFWLPNGDDLDSRAQGS